MTIEKALKYQSSSRIRERDNVVILTDIPVEEVYYMNQSPCGVM